jgi:hypothetical protein
LVVPIATLIGRSHAPDALTTVESGSPRHPGELSPGIRRALPDAVDFIGAWYDPRFREELSEAKILLRISACSPVRPAGLKLRCFDAWQQGARIAVRIRAVDLDPKRPDAVRRGVPVLRFADGTYATCTQARMVRLRGSRWFAGATDWECTATFVSPLSLPEFAGDPEGLLEGLEILWFAEDGAKPVFTPAEIGESLWNQQEKEEEALFQSIDAIECFKQIPWTPRAWRDGVLPFLLRNLEESDLPLLLEYLPADPRLTEVIARKGWFAQALPVLRQQAAGRFPTGAVGFSLLAAELDASWNDDLMALALGSRSGLELWEKALRGKPGFDWDAYAREAWRRRKTQINWLETDSAGEFWLVALWAAQAGDESAFRHTVEHAARGKAWELGQLEHLIEDSGGAPLERIRAAGMDSFRYDPEARRWVSR